MPTCSRRNAYYFFVGYNKILGKPKIKKFAESFGLEIIVFSVLKKVSPAPASVEPVVFLALYHNVGERPTTGLVVGPAAKKCARGRRANERSERVYISEVFKPA